MTVGYWSPIVRDSFGLDYLHLMVPVAVAAWK